MFDIVAVYDKKAGQHFEPRFTRNTAQMVRDFMDLCNDDKTSINKYPNDFCLVSLGTYNESTGELITNRKTIVEAVACKRNLVKDQEQKEK